MTKKQKKPASKAAQKEKSVEEKPTKPTQSKSWPTLVIGAGILAGVLYVGWQYAGLQQQEEYPIGTGADMEEAEVVARTEPDVGEVLSSAIIQTEDTAEATSITVLSEPEGNTAEVTPPVVDVTAKIASLPTDNKIKPTLFSETIKDAVEDAQSARFAQTTIMYRQGLEKQNLRLVTLYNAYINNVPEVRWLLAEAQQHAQGVKQKRALEALAASVQEHGIVNSDELEGLVYQTVMPYVEQLNVVESYAVETTHTGGNQVMPKWFENTLGRLVTVRQASSVNSETSVVDAQEEMMVTTSNQESVSQSDQHLLEYVQKNQWAQVNRLLKQQEYDHNKYEEMRVRVQAYVVQHQLVLDLLRIALK